MRRQRSPEKYDRRQSRGLTAHRAEFSAVPVVSGSDGEFFYNLCRPIKITSGADVTQTPTGANICHRRQRLSSRSMSGRLDLRMKNTMLERLFLKFDVDVQAMAICRVSKGVRLHFSPLSAIEVHYVLEGTMHLTVPGAASIFC